MATTAPAPVRLQTRPHSWRRVVMIAAAIVVVGLAIAIFVVNRYWPFTEQRVIESLQEASDSRVQVQAFHRTYFPHPGCVLDGVTFLHDGLPKPLMTIERITIATSYPELFARHLSQVDAERLQIFIPPFGSGQTFHPQPATVIIDELVANGATLEFASRDPQSRPLRFDIHEAQLRAVGAPGPMPYRIRVHNPQPPGEVTAEGELGDWQINNSGQTSLSGKYKFENADLGVYGGVAGTLSSQGEYKGTLAHIDISGATDTHDFEVTSGGHKVHLTSQFSAYVDAIHGDTFLNRVEARFRKTEVIAEGSIAGSNNTKEKGKVARLNFSSSNGRIEDLLGLFVTAPRSPMSGAVTLHAQVEIPSGDRRFLEKVKLRGNFGIGGGEFTKPSTQQGVDKLSAGARGEKQSDDPETVLTDLTGKVSADDGIANFSDLSFGVPGAAARMHGIYGLISHKIDLRGQMQVRTKISNTETGAKALILKAMDPFFKKKKKGEVLPVHIGGNYGKPTFGLDLHDSKAQSVAPPHMGTRHQ